MKINDSVIFNDCIHQTSHWHIAECIVKKKKLFERRVYLLTEQWMTGSIQETRLKTVIMFSIQFGNASGAEISSSALNLSIPISLPITCTFFPPQGANQSFHHYTNLSQSCQYSSRPRRSSQVSHCHAGSCPHMSAHALSALIQGQNIALNIGKRIQE